VDVYGLANMAGHLLKIAAFYFIYKAVIETGFTRPYNLLFRNLNAYAEQLKQSNRELQDFASIASHDLQEPLRKVQAFGERLNERYAPALGEEGRDYIERMQSAAARMQQMIEDLLAYSRVTTRAQALEPVDLSEILGEVLSDLEIRLERTGGRVEAGALPSVEADPMQMRQLLQNLVGNALKFHRPDAPPVVRVYAQDHRKETPDRGDGKSHPSPPSNSHVRIVVEDNGIGFDEKRLEEMFKPFHRLHGRSEYEGSGMGLAICRKIAERHGGSIQAQSKPGQGARFIVTLPAKNDGG
jgi:signal transduction histidine kinase